MNSLKTFVKSDSIPKYSYWTSDLFKSKGIKLFYLSKEGIQAYCSGLGVEQRRQIALQIEDALETLLMYSYKEDEIEFIQELLSRNKNVLSKVKKVDQGLYNHLKSINPKGIEILEVPKNIDLQLLKKLYKKASKKYHPDMGGSHEKMLIVNEAFTLFHDAIVSHIPIGGEGDNTVHVTSFPETWNDWLYSIHLVLSCIDGDFFAADRAFPHLQMAYEYAFSSSNSYVGQFAENLMGIGGVLDRTCRVLGRFGMLEELQEAAQITAYLIDRIVQDWAPRSEVDFRPERDYYPTREDFENEYGVKIVLNHPEQAKNAYRLGKIDQKRFEATMKRFKFRVSDEENVFSQINEFIKEKGFITKLLNADYNLEVTNPQIIGPPVFSQERFDHLEDEQKWEYLKAFSPEGNGELFKKYYQIRTQEIFLGLIHNYNSIDLLKLKEEIDFFCNNLDKCFDQYLTVAAFLGHLCSLGDIERQKKLKVLREMDDPEPDSLSNGFTITITLDSINNTIPTGGFKKKVKVDDDYIEFAMQEVSDLENYQKTGKFHTGYSDAWNRDIEALDKFKKTAVAKGREKVWLHTDKPSPEQVIESSEPYIEGLLELGKSFHPKNTGELQVGYDISRLTTAYAKLKRRTKVVYWAQLYFDLPRNYRDRSSEGEEEKIRKRLERAKREYQKFGNVEK